VEVASSRIYPQEYPYKKGKAMKGAKIVTLLVAVCLYHGAWAQVRQFDLPTMDAVHGIPEFARQAGIQIVAPADDLGAISTPSIHGNFDVRTALNKLLVGTDLEIASDDGTVITLRRRVKTKQSENLGSANAQQPISATMAVATDDSSSSANVHGLDEIVVTAEKRSEKLVDVPASVSAITGSQLESLGVQSISDLAAYVPGLFVENGGTPGQRTIVIRGLSTGYSPATTAPLVATYIDDAPVGATGATVRGAQFGLDLMPYDLERIEVLRGPQGTLYGADSMGGIVKYVLKQPDLNQFDYRVGADSSYIDNSAGVTYNARSAVNVPLIPGTVAMRISGTYQQTAGYINNVGTRIDHSNYSTESGARVALLWKPTDQLSAQASFVVNNIDAADNTAVTVRSTTLQPAYGQYSQFTYVPEPFKQQTLFGDLAINWDLGFATLTSSSSWSKLDSTIVSDLTPAFGAYVPNTPNGLAYSYILDAVSKYTEEVRLVSPDNQLIQWAVGGLYTREAPAQMYSLPTLTALRAPLPYDLYFSQNSLPYVEQAGFGDASYRVTDQFDVGGGVRYAQYKNYGCTESGGVLLGGVTTETCQHAPFFSKTTWMTDARYHLDQDSMVYGRIATGYRPGGGCTGCGSKVLGEPDFYYSDSITNYEIGTKGQYFQHRLEIDLSIFHINWSGIQLSVLSPEKTIYPGNGGTAVSNGLEFTSTYRPTNELTLTSTLAYTSAHLTEDAPGVHGNNGDQLPQTARWMGSLIADYRQPLNDTNSLLFGGNYRYRDKVLNQLAGTGEPLPMGPQNIVDLYTGFAQGSLAARLYAKNAFNNHSYVGLLNLTNPQLPSFVPIQPRTIGVSVDYSFR
jgi:iron complex outermembrane recepter protein